MHNPGGNNIAGYGPTRITPTCTLTTLYSSARKAGARSHLELDRAIEVLERPSSKALDVASGQICRHPYVGNQRASP